MKVFNISPHRSGTRSFHEFCAAHGLRSAHWCGHVLDEAAEAALPALDSEELFIAAQGHFTTADVFSDLPCPLLYRELLRAWPDSKFVVVRRDPMAWTASVRRHTDGRNLEPLERFFYWAWCIEQRETMAPYSDAELLAAYHGYLRETTEALTRAGVDFRVFELSDPGIGAAIADFLGIEQTHPFEHIGG